MASGGPQPVADFEALLGLPCGLGVRDQRAPNAFGDLARRCFRHLGRPLAVPADPVPPSYRMPDELDAVRRPTSLLQTDADVGW